MNRNRFPLVTAVIFSLYGAANGNGTRQACYASLTAYCAAVYKIERCFRWGRSAVGSAPRWHRGGRGFESPRLHQRIYKG